MMGHKERLKSGDEYDKVFFPHMYCYLKRASKKIKKRMNRRQRRKDKTRMRGEA